MRIKYWIFLVLVIACQPRDIVQVNPAYFDLKGLLAEQVQIMDSLKPELVKVAYLENEIDSISFRPDSAAWAREFEIFSDLDINRPVLRDKYEVSTHNDSLLNNEITNYTLKEGDDAELLYLNIYKKNKQLLRIEGEFREKSLLYDAYRILYIHFDTHTKENRISNYYINGWQKIILNDTVFYQVMADVNY